MANHFVCHTLVSFTLLIQRFLVFKGFCNNLWGGVYIYTTDSDECMVMDFEGDNPNIHGNMKPKKETEKPEKKAAAQAVASNTWINTIIFALWWLYKYGDGY